MSSEKINISKMKKDFSRFLFENCVKFFFRRIFFAFCSKSFLFHKKIEENILTYNLFNLSPSMPLVFFNKRRFKCLKRRILFFSVYLKSKILRCFDIYFDIIQIKYTSFLAFANDVYLILLVMSRYNHAAF
jgi:hypothetical protein